MEIYTSRKKNIFLLFLSLLFLAAGIYFVLHGEEIAAGKRSPLLVQGIGIAAIALPYWLYSLPSRIYLTSDGYFEPIPKAYT